MAKKVTFSYRVMHCFTYHPWLKLIALALAIIAFLYIRDEMMLLAN